MVACSSESDRFRLEGRLRNMNQGEFWVYSPDGAMAKIGIDTIRVRDGRFSYELSLSEPATLVIVFPNYSEQPVFASPGKTVTIKGDATHLKEMIIEGTDDNEDMTTLRLQLNDLTPPDIPDAVAAFIKKHPESPASVYALQRYFLLNPNPNYRDALQLTKVLQQANPDSRPLQAIAKVLRRLQGAQTGSKMPRFNATDIHGHKVTEAQLKSDVNVVTTWATWSYQSTGAMQQLRMLKKKYGDRLSLVSICLDGNINECRQRAQRDSITWPTICDGKMWDSPLLASFALGSVPDNVLIDGQGRVIAHSMEFKRLEERIEAMMRGKD